MRWPRLPILIDPAFKDPNRSFEVLSLQLEAQNWSLLGEGAFSTVYENSRYPRIVYKMFRDDKAYLKFLKHIEGRRNPHFPLHHGLGMIPVAQRVSAEYRYWGVYLERLQRRRQNRYTDLAESVWFRGSYESPSRNRILDVKHRWPSFYRACLHLRGLRRHAVWADFHWGNILFRGNCPVLTDPLS
jgi:hypothetical protein